MSHYAVHSPFEADKRFADHYRYTGKPKVAADFATLIEGMDKSLGDIMDHLEELGIAGNTLIIFLGDNGSDAPLGMIKVTLLLLLCVERKVPNLKVVFVFRLSLLG